MTAPMAAFVSRLLSLGLAGQDLTDVLGLAEAAFAGPARDGGSADGHRERERLRKADYRRRKAANVPGHVPGQRESDIHKVTKKSSDSGKKVSKSAAAVVPGQKRDTRNRGELLPADWKPKESHYAKGLTFGFDRARVDFFAERMRNWAGANAHRPVAKKSNWDQAFHNWMSDKAEKNGGTNGKAESTLGGYSGLGARLRAKIDAEGSDGEGAAAGPQHRG